MSRGTADVLPKPPTAKQIERAIAKYEPAMNDVIELTKRLDPESVAGIEGRWIRESAFTLDSQVRALHDHLADNESESK